MSETWIGTSGYVYPHWRGGVFYPPELPQKEELEFYCRHFRTVELNNQLTDVQAKKLREYLLRGGFFMCDDFWGEFQWEVFRESMKRVLPDRPIVEIEDTDSIFHTVYDLDERFQVPGARYTWTGRTEKCEGCPAHWRGIYDDKGRLMVAMCFNSDVGDSWEWEDDPNYAEKFSWLGVRLGVNYVVYAMSH